MSNKVIVTIGREFGSGGHEVGKRLATELGIKFYDNEFISMAVQKTGFHEDYVKNNEEKAPDLQLVHSFQELSCISHLHSIRFRQRNTRSSEKLLPRIAVLLLAVVQITYLETSLMSAFSYLLH